jgi:hypothetical protein
VNVEAVREWQVVQTADAPEAACPMLALVVVADVKFVWWHLSQSLAVEAPDHLGAAVLGL